MLQSTHVCHWSLFDGFLFDDIRLHLNRQVVAGDIVAIRETHYVRGGDGGVAGGQVDDRPLWVREPGQDMISS